MVVLLGTAPFVARERELDVLGEMLGALERDRGSAALVRAPAGTGKTRLVAESLHRSAPGAATVLRATGAELQRDVPFGAASDLVSASPLPTTAGGFAGCIERRALEGPVVVVADDLQWWDESSLLVLEKLALSTGDLPLSLLLVTRPAPVPVGLPRLERALEAAHLGAVVELPPLEGREVRELASLVLDDRPAPEVLALLDGTNGNALHATTVLRHVQATGRLQDETVQSGIAAAVRRYLRELPGPTVDALAWAAVLGVRFSLDDLADVLGTTLTEVAATLQPAVDLGVLETRVDGAGFTHDLVRDALHDMAPGEVTARRHARVLTTLREAGAPVTRWSGHLDVAALTEVAGAPALLHHAAASPLPVPAHRRAAWLDRAVALHDDPPVDLSLDLLDARRHARDLEGHATLLEDLLARVDEMTPSQRTRLGLCAAFGAEDRHATLDLQRELVAAGADEGAQLLVDLLEAEQQGVVARAAAARRVLEPDVAVEHPELRARAAFVLTLEETDDDRLDRLVDEVLAAGRQQVLHEARFAGVLALASAGGTFSRAAPLVDEAIDLAVQLDSQAQWPLRAAQLQLLLWSGEWGVALRQDWRPVVEQLTAAPSRDWSAFTLPFLLTGVLLDRGEVDDARWASERLDELAARSRSSLRGEMRRRVAVIEHQSRAMLHLDDGDLEAARADLDAIVDVGDWDVAVLAARAGANDLAERCAMAAVARAEENPNGRNERNRRWARAAAACSAVPLDGSTTPQWAVADQRWVDGLQLDEVLGDLHVGDADHDAAVDHLRRALDWYDERGSRTGAARVRAKLRDLGQAADATAPSDTRYGWDAVTPAEWRTLDLVEQDLLYREAAERLFLSRRTVESHVASARRKLEAPDRRALARMLREGEGAERLATWRADPT